jgi:hypothetical protein
MNITGLGRNTIDKYYTKLDVAKTCIELVEKYYDINMFDNIIEPAAGNGSFSKQIDNCIAYDILPDDDEKRIIKQDFLTSQRPPGETLIIGNPPFGRQSSIAKSFIYHACSFACVIAFILPKSFKKESFQRIFPLNWHLIDQLDLPANSFTVDGRVYDVPCVFQIWEKQDTERKIDAIEEVDWIEYTTADKANLSVRRVGVNAGFASSNLLQSKQSHYFIKVSDDVSVKDIIKKINDIKWEFDNTVGPKSISKKELNAKLSEISV